MERRGVAVAAAPEELIGKAAAIGAGAAPGEAALLGTDMGGGRIVQNTERVDGLPKDGSESCLDGGVGGRAGSDAVENCHWDLEIE